MAIDLQGGMLRAAMGGGASTNKNFEPQRVNNALIRITMGDQSAGDSEIIGLSVSTMALPKTNNGVIEVGYFNEKRKFAGNAVFDDLQITMNDYLDADTVRILQAWRYQVYNPETGQIGLASQYKKTGEITLFQPDGDESRVRIWKLYGIWPSTFDPGEVDLEGEGVMKINMTLTIDKAIPGNRINPNGTQGNLI